MPATFPWRLVTFDVDGTLTRGHGWRPIAAAFGRLPEYDASNRRFLARASGEDEHLADLLNIATGHTTSEVGAIVDATPTLAGIAEGVRTLHALGARVALLTHNPRYVTDRYLARFGFDDCEGVDAQDIVAGRIGPAEGVRADKRLGLRRLLDRAATDARHAVHVGDGWADIPVFRTVGGAVALNSALPEVNAAADLRLTADDLREVVGAIERLGPRS